MNIGLWSHTDFAQVTSSSLNIISHIYNVGALEESPSLAFLMRECSEASQ